MPACRLTNATPFTAARGAKAASPAQLTPGSAPAGAHADGPAISDFRLDNGMDVIVIPDHRAPVATHMVWYRNGSADDPLGKSGIAHFLEHMAFKGTARRSARAIAEEIESAGGEINASTGMETTTYYARVLKHDWALALDILADILTQSVLDPEELERERTMPAGRAIGRGPHHVEGAHADEVMRRTVHLPGLQAAQHEGRADRFLVIQIH